MEITFEPINGICIGGEYVPPEDEDTYSAFLLDLVLLRVIFQW